MASAKRHEMALQCQQIVNLACQIAKAPGFTVQAGQLLNYTLSDLAQTFDFEVNLITYGFTFDTGTIYQNNTSGAGPTLFPANFLRAKNKEIIFYILGVRYVLVILSQDEFDALVQTPGMTSYPTFGYVDLALQAPFNTSNPGQPGLMVWPPASGAYTAQLRYYSLPADVASPETSSVIPWFPNTDYLVTRVAGELMKLTNDERCTTFLGDSDSGSVGILRNFLKMKDNPEGVAKRVTLDRRFFGSSWRSLPNTKIIGWTWVLTILSDGVIHRLLEMFPWS